MEKLLIILVLVGLMVLGGCGSYDHMESVCTPLCLEDGMTLAYTSWDSACICTDGNGDDYVIEINPTTHKVVDKYLGSDF